MDIGNLVSGWKATLEAINKYLKEHNARGRAFLAKGKLREAYIEFSWVTPFNGPESDSAKADLLKVQDCWIKLLDIARESPPTSRERATVIKGLRKDTEGLAFAKTLDKAIQSLDAPKTDVAQADPPAVASAPAPKAVEPTAMPTAMPAVENKTLKQVASMAVPVTNSTPDSDETLIDTRLLAASSEQKLKTAERSIQDGLSAYKRALADNMDRGEERNRLLKEAHGFFDIGLKLIDEVTGGKPDAQTDKLMSRVSMLMYGCLKYQTL
jgi:hypothetical protein